MGLQPVLIAGQLSGLTTNVKPWLVPDQAFTTLFNAYVFRDRVIKRECLRFLGRLQRTITDGALGSTSGGSTSFTLTDIFTTLSITDPNPEIAYLLKTQNSSQVPLKISVGAPDTATFTDLGNGTFSVTGAGVAAGSYINYETGKIVLNFSAPTGVSLVTITFGYYPSQPVMGISQYETTNINVDTCVAFDQTYAYKWSTTQFVQLGTDVWADTNYNGYWTTNFSIGPTAATINRYFFVTNFVPTNANPMRYTINGTSWTAFAPALDGAGTLLQQALILVPYYGRLIALNTREGKTDIAGSVNFFTRCRFAAIGDPTLTDAWKVNVPGQGGFIDAPTNEAIISAAFFKNTLIVYFENSTWQLRYLGEYGLPFLWERISSDFGSVSTFSPVVFDNGVAVIGDKAITQTTDGTCQRIDNDIPDQIFDFEYANNGNQRVQGIRDFQRELALWGFVSAPDEINNYVFPNRVLVYNYRNNTWAIFRDNVTAFGTFMSNTGDNDITWDDPIITWDDENVTWDDVNNTANFPFVVAGNQQGFVHYYGYDETPDDPSLSISAVAVVSGQAQLTILNHNFEADDIFFVTNLQFLDSSTFLPVVSPIPDGIYGLNLAGNSANTILLTKWNGSSYGSFPLDLTGITYVGGGLVALRPRMNIITKDFNPYQTENKQMKISSIDFMTDASDAASITVNLYANAQQAQSGNIPLGNNEVETSLPSLYPNFPAFYMWHRFYATLVGQFIRIQITYDDVLMNDPETHVESFELNGIKLNVKPGGQLVF